MADKLSTERLGRARARRRAPTHGWALAAKLARGGEVGSIWAVSRPIVYHGLDRLERCRPDQAAGSSGAAAGRTGWSTRSRPPAGRSSKAGSPRRSSTSATSARSSCSRSCSCSAPALDPEPLLVAQRAVLVPVRRLARGPARRGRDEAPGETTSLPSGSRPRAGSCASSTRSSTARSSPPVPRPVPGPPPVPRPVPGPPASGRAARDADLLLRLRCFRQLGIRTSVGARNT